MRYLLLAFLLMTSPTAAYDENIERVRNEISDCYVKWVREFSLKTCEPAETVIKAATSACTLEIDSYREAILNDPKAAGLSLSDIDGAVGRYVGELKKLFLGPVLQLRVNEGKACN